MALRLDNEYYDLIDGAVRSPDVEAAIRILQVCRAHIVACHTELRELRAHQRNHERQLAERDGVIAALRAELNREDRVV